MCYDWVETTEPEGEKDYDLSTTYPSFTHSCTPIHFYLLELRGVRLGADLGGCSSHLSLVPVVSRLVSIPFLFGKKAERNSFPDTWISFCDSDRSRRFDIGLHDNRTDYNDTPCAAVPTQQRNGDFQVYLTDLDSHLP